MFSCLWVFSDFSLLFLDFKIRFKIFNMQKWNNSLFIVYMPMPSKRSTKNKRRQSKKRYNIKGGFADAQEYANGVYGTPQHAVSANDNTIAMQQIRGGELPQLSPMSLEGASQGLSDQGAASVGSSSMQSSVASSATDAFAGGEPAKDPDNSIHLGGRRRFGGKVGLEELIVPAGLLVANQWVGKSRRSKKSSRRRRGSRRR